MKNWVLVFGFFLLSFGVNAQSKSSEEYSSKKEVVSKQKIKVFPNPATNVVNILGLKNSHRATITISDISGNIALHREWAIRNNAVSIPIPNLIAGIYVVRIVSKEQQIQTKFLKK
jgi:hypothetical protein